MAEQYELLPRDGFCLIKTLLAHWVPNRIEIRKVGSKGGGNILCEELQGKTLEVRRSHTGLTIKVSGCAPCDFVVEKSRERRASGKEWAIFYDRRKANGVMSMASTGYKNPDDSSLPNVVASELRVANEMLFMQIFFSGKIPIRKVRPLFPNDPIMGYYWEIVTPPNSE